MSARQPAPVIEDGAAAVRAPRLVVFSSLFPNRTQPMAGVFIRERMFRVGRQLPLVVVSPKPWFPFQRLIRRIRPGYRPTVPEHDRVEGVDLYCPRFLSLPLLGRSLDGLSMALCVFPTMRRLEREYGFEIIDAHFAYPDGYAATLLARWLKKPACVTLRGTEVPLSKFRWRRRLILAALKRADRVFAVAESLKQHVVSLGADGAKVRVVGNGVDTALFSPVSQRQAREKLGIPDHAKVMVTVGGLVPRKGFHRVLACMPELLKRIPQLHYLIVGGPSPEGDMSQQLHALSRELKIADRVRFLGPIVPGELKWPLSAADVFVLSTSNEGWANVFLEAMACGLPVVTTDVGGNRQVVSSNELGLVVPFGDQERLCESLAAAFEQSWDRNRIISYAKANSWDQRVEQLVAEFQHLATHRR